MEDAEHRPFGAIFWFEGYDLTVQPDVDAAEGYIEPYDVSAGEIYDERGRRLNAQVVGEGWPRRIRILVVDAEPQLPDLMGRVRSFLEAVGEPIPSDADASMWLREAASIIARQDHQDLAGWFRRIRERFR